MTVNPLALAFLLGAGDGVSGLGGELRQRTCGGMMMMNSCISIERLAVV